MLLLGLLTASCGTIHVKGDNETPQPEQTEESVGSLLLWNREPSKVVIQLGESRFDQRNREARELAEQSYANALRGGDIRALTQIECGRAGVDWKLVYAIGQHESANYTRYPGGYNYWGRKAIGGGWQKWATLQEAVANQCRYIESRYYRLGLNTPEKIQPVYCPDGTPWAQAIRKYMSKLD